MKLFQKYQLLITGKIVDINIEECMKLIEYYPYDSARIIKQLTSKKDKCYICNFGKTDLKRILRKKERKICIKCNIDLDCGII